MSGRRAPHLKRRNGIYHLRMRVPDRLRERVGWQEVCKSLHTYSPTLARRLAASVSAKVLETFAMLDEITNVTPQEARMLLQACFADIQREIDRRHPHVPMTPYPDLEIEEQTSLAEECIARLRCENDHKTYSVGTKKAAEHALAGRGIDLQLISPEARALLLDGFCRLLIEEQRMSVARLQDPLADYQPADPLFSGSPAGAQLAIVADLPPLGITLGRAIQEYLNARKKVWQAKTHAARVVHLGYLADFLGPDRLLSDIEAADVRRFRNALSMLRANHGRKTHLTFHERLTENAEAKIKNKTARLIFEPIKAFFRWAKEDEGLIPANPAADVRWQLVADPKVTRTRRPFTDDELQRLFSSPLFSGCKSRYRRFEPGDVVIKDAKYWVPIIGYYTGMRLGEIIQLHVGDVVLDADVPHFDLNENYGSGDRKH